METQTLNLAQMPTTADTLEMLRLHLVMHYAEIDEVQMNMYRWVAWMLGNALEKKEENIKMMDIMAEAYEMSEKGSAPLDVLDTEYEGPESKATSRRIVSGDINSIKRVMMSASGPGEDGTYQIPAHEAMPLEGGRYSGRMVDGRHLILNINDDLFIFRPAKASDVIKCQHLSDAAQMMALMIVSTGWKNFNALKSADLEEISASSYLFIIGQFTEYNHL